MTVQESCQTTYGLEVRQKTGEWQVASTGRSREYADNVFRQYVADGETCRIKDSEGVVISEDVPAPLERQRIDLARTQFLVTAWPDQRWPIEVVWFIEDVTRGITLRTDHRESLKVRDRTCARNTAIVRALKSAHYDWFVFIDNDVRPDIRSVRFLDLDADVICCQVPMRSSTAWSWPNSFHESMWCTSRSVLEAIEPPWFMQAYSQDGTQLDGCICKSFQKKVLEAGFSIAHGGWAEHDRDQSWC